MRRCAAALVLFLPLLSALAGCSSPAERLYRRAEAFLAQGQFEMAAEEYQRLAAEHPRSPLADDALYKLAYIYAEEMDRPGAALAQYWVLADNYPTSPYADDALVRAMTIQRRHLRDPEAVRATYQELCRRFPDRRELGARGLLEVARALFEAESYDEAAQVASELTQRYADQQSEAAQAALLHARACKRTGVAAEQVEQLFEEVIRRYPETYAAVAAKRELGWSWYAKREQHEREQAEEVRRRSRVISGVPAHASQEGQLLQALSALRAALAHRGASCSMERLIGLSGAAFVIVFDPERPSLGRSTLDVRPFETVSEALGFAHNVWSGASAEEAFAWVHQALLQGHPVLVLHGSPRRWVLVTGYDAAQSRVYYMPPGAEDYAAVGRDSFLRGWAEASRSNSGVAGPEPFYQFALGARTATPDEGALRRATAERAARAMRLTSLAGAPAGEDAWKALGEHLAHCASATATEQRERAAAWVADGLLPFLSLAQTGTGLLRDAAGAVEGLAEAAEQHADMVAEARVVAQKVNEARQAEEPAEAKWQAAAAQANYVAVLHARLAQTLADATGG
ncbi:MAG: tetratricopeptide repeat protein [Armatimonadota bacterium]